MGGGGVDADARRPGKVGRRVVVAGEDGEAEVFDSDVGRWLLAGSCTSPKGRLTRGARWRGVHTRVWTDSCAIAGGQMYIVAEYGEWCLKANGGWWPAAGCHRTPPHARRWGRRSLDEEVLPHHLTRSPAVSKLALKYSKSTTTAPAR